MTVRAIAGLVGLNAGFAVVGTSLLFALSGYRTWAEVLGRLGLAHLLGAAAFGALWTQLLVLGVPLRGPGVVASLAALAAAGVIAGRLRARQPPRALGVGRLGRLALVTAAGIAASGLVLEALFRAARLQSLQAYDAWAFWVPKAKAIFFFGELDEQVFTTTPGPSYPPLLPILDAASFHAMGGADVVTLHLQFWFLVVGGVAAVAACLHGRAPAWLLWPSLVLVLVVPRFGERLLTPQADVLAALFFVVGALLVAFWLREAGTWRIAAATLLLAAGGLTKREGLAFAACVLAAAAVASIRRERRAWLELGAAAAAIAAAALPWRLWYAARDIPSDAPSAAGSDLGRLWDALRLSADVLYANDLWSVVPIVASLALVAAVVWGDRRLALYLGAALGLAFLGGAWVTYGYAELPVTAEESVNPIVRYTGAIVLLAAAATPLLLASAWRGREAAVKGRTLSAAVALVLAVPLLGYPAAVLADGARFPSRDDCVRVAPEGSSEPLDLVFGRRATPAEADTLRDEVAGVGYVDAEVRGDGCGRWKVLYDGIETYEQGVSSRAEARGAGLDAELEIEPPG